MQHRLQFSSKAIHGQFLYAGVSTQRFMYPFVQLVQLFQQRICVYFLQILFASAPIICEQLLPVVIDIV